MYDSQVNLVLVDDHKIVRRGLSLLFNDDANISVVGEANNGEEALELIDNILPDVVLTDITMPIMNGIQLIKQLSKKHPQIKVVVLSMHLDHDYVVSAMSAGAKGYVSKDAEGEDIIKAIHKVNNGEVFLTESISHLLAMGVINKKNAKPKKKPKANLTVREQEILTQIAKGSSSKEVASELNISLRTVNVHKYNIMKKLDAPNSVSLIRIAIARKLVKI